MQQIRPDYPQPHQTGQSWPCLPFPLPTKPSLPSMLPLFTHKDPNFTPFHPLGFLFLHPCLTLFFVVSVYFGISYFYLQLFLPILIISSEKHVHIRVSESKNCEQKNHYDDSLDQVMCILPLNSLQLSNVYQTQTIYFKRREGK